MSMEFAAKISALRKEKNITQKKAADELGISQALLSHYEKGIREGNLDFVKKAAAYYDVTTDYLLGLNNFRGSGNEIFDKNDLPSDTQVKVKTVMRELFRLAENAELSDDNIKIFFTDYFTLCISRYLKATDHMNNSSTKLCDLSLRILCENVPETENSGEKRLFTDTIEGHAMMLIQNILKNELDK